MLYFKREPKVWVIRRKIPQSPKERYEKIRSEKFHTIGRSKFKRTKRHRISSASDRRYFSFDYFLKSIQLL